MLRLDLTATLSLMNLIRSYQAKRRATTSRMKTIKEIVL